MACFLLLSSLVLLHLADLFPERIAEAAGLFELVVKPCDCFLRVLNVLPQRTEFLLLGFVLPAEVA